MKMLIVMRVQVTQNPLLEIHEYALAGIVNPLNEIILFGCDVIIKTRSL